MNDKRNIILAVGIFSILIGILLLGLFSSELSFRNFFLRPTLLLLLGAVTIYISLVSTRYPLFTFSGMFFCCAGVLFLLIDAKLVKSSVEQLWPILVIMSGIFLFPSCYLRSKKITSSYVVPAVCLVCLGLLFLLFSMDIIKTPLRTFAARWWPFVLIIFGIGLVILFFLSQYQKSPFSLTEEDDEDEDIS